MTTASSSERAYAVCANCIVDTSDSTITFDARGWCDYCNNYHRRYGTRPLTTFPTADIFTYRFYYRFVKGIRVVKPLNCVPYIKEDAIQELVDRFGWQRYTHKHHESRFTRFYEAYWLPTKFGFDKRRVHFSSLVLTGQMTRDEALARIAQPACDKETMAQDFEFVATGLVPSVTQERAPRGCSMSIGASSGADPSRPRPRRLSGSRRHACPDIVRPHHS